MHNTPGLEEQRKEGGIGSLNYGTFAQALRRNAMYE